jgi:CheY-like chemotaxis protein
MVSRLLAFGRSHASDPQDVDINECVAGIEPILRRLAGPEVRLSKRFAADLGTVRLDPSGFDQILTNLVANARDAMPMGGSLTIETANVEFDAATAVRRRGTMGGPHVMIAVSDSGVGMDPSIANSIFEPFFTTKTKGKGTGLGLATVQKMVEENGGSIWVYSEVGSGTTFRLYFPCVSVRGSGSKSTKFVADRPPTGDEVILLVEDDTAIRAAVRGWLERLGYSVVDAPGGEEAIEIVKNMTSAPDLLITDVVMSGMNGAAVTEAMRVHAPQIAVVVISGHSRDSLLEQALLDPASHFVEKPFSLGDLATEVRQALDARV